MGNGKSFQDRFWAKIQRTETCWDWTGAINSRGYGVIKKNDNLLLAHRYSYQEHKGKIPTGISIDHVCHNKRCVNPSHLRLATDKQNNENRSGANRNSTTGVLGVSRTQDGKMYRVQVMHNRKNYQAGPFVSIEEAERAAIVLRNSMFTHNNLDRVAM
ncbi:HNH endonuclease signature motif containing protein [Glutamicibacter mishrai]|uniref:HNH endonuclease n=1 Tax=Glutamicibacter mishrai TaxID=1775880 RepID=A0A6H0SM81_9MICC|nr:HNH endonuclease signature motif containing protein [Glutamicibacter mishrai]QIV87529.1 HNH endonuclease [Glutamicibacter mishrai]